MSLLLKILYTQKTLSIVILALIFGIVLVGYVLLATNNVRGEYRVEELKNKIMETEKSNNQLRINLTYASSLEYILEQSSMLSYAEIENVKYLKKPSTSPFASR